MEEKDTDETSVQPRAQGASFQMIGAVSIAVLFCVGIGSAVYFSVENYKDTVAEYKAQSAARDALTAAEQEYALNGTPVPDSLKLDSVSPPAVSSPTNVPEAAPLNLSTPLTILGFTVGPLLAIKFTAPVVMSQLRRRKESKANQIAHAQTWNELYQHRDDIVLQWSRYETDVSLMIDYPIMTDYTDPVIKGVISAMQKMRRAETATIRDNSQSAEGSALRVAVDEFEVAFLAAEKYAKRYGQSKLEAHERKKLSAARQALNIILNEESPAYEVEAAYKSLRGSLKGIIDLPVQAIAALESHSRKSLEAAPA